MQAVSSFRKSGIALLTITLILGLHCLVTSPGSARTSKDSSGQVSIAPRKDYAAAAEMLERFITHEMADKKLPALSIALVDDQQIVWAKGFGFADPKSKTPATAETVYRVGSVSKLFTDIAVMQLVAQTRINLFRHSIPIPQRPPRVAALN